MASRNTFYINPKPCKHLTEYKYIHGLSGYKSLQKCFKTRPHGRTSIKKCELEVPRCSSCAGFQGRLYLCLICSSVSCSTHTFLHAQSANGHDIAVDIERSELYCCLCNDQVYDPDFDKLVVAKSIMDMASNAHPVEDIWRRTSKRRKMNVVVDLDLDFEESKLSVSNRDQRAKSCYPLGLRGLKNLGSTCFMNSVLQVLVHAPPFRNYFLNGRHNRESCRTRSANQLCLACDMGAVLTDMCSADQTPYTAAHFLYSWWQHSANLACYEEQDAHEFFISVLDRIHEKDGKESNPNNDIGDCQCISHKVFSGMLRSDITCMTCGFTSTTYDPCVDISLELDTSNCSPAEVSGKSHTTGETGRSTLFTCFDLFTRPEKLGSDQKPFCQKCQEYRDSVKQLSIRRLPLVLSLHIKRFEHSATKKMLRKVDMHLQFPFSLNLAPYLSSSIVSHRLGNRMSGFDNDEMDAEFEIFAMIAHSGMLHSGHYVTYVRLRNQWYKCDDAWITEVDEGIVRASQCYMMFYVQKMIYNKANEDKSCTPLSLTKDLPLPVAGCCYSSQCMN